jgi:hypothetical protein
LAPFGPVASMSIVKAARHLVDSCERYQDHLRTLHLNAQEHHEPNEHIMYVHFNKARELTNSISALWASAQNQQVFVYQKHKGQPDVPCRLVLSNEALQEFQKLLNAMKSTTRLSKAWHVQASKFRELLIVKPDLVWMTQTIQTFIDAGDWPCGTNFDVVIRANQKLNSIIQIANI